MTVLYNNGTYAFILKKTEKEGRSCAQITRIPVRGTDENAMQKPEQDAIQPVEHDTMQPVEQDTMQDKELPASRSTEEVVLLDYCWAAQLKVEIEPGETSLREDGALCWQLHVTAHHAGGMVQGEFTETEWFEVEHPFGTPQEMVCRTVDIVRKTRFAIAERHLKHLPHQTYPPVDGRQGPYGHP